MITEITTVQNVFTNELRQKERMDIGSQNLKSDEAMFQFNQRRSAVCRLEFAYWSGCSGNRTSIASIIIRPLVGAAATGECCPEAVAPHSQNR